MWYYIMFYLKEHIAYNLMTVSITNITSMSSNEITQLKLNEANRYERIKERHIGENNVVWSAMGLCQNCVNAICI